MKLWVSSEGSSHIDVNVVMALYVLYVNMSLLFPGITSVQEIKDLDNYFFNKYVVMPFSHCIKLNFILLPLRKHELLNLNLSNVKCNEIYFLL